MERGHYEVLGVPRDADLATMRRAYVALARRHHPDRPGGDAERMRAVNQAWTVLSDPHLRERYDLALHEPPTRTQPMPPRRPERDPWGRDPRYDPTDDISEEELNSDHILFERLFEHEAADLRSDLRDTRSLGRTVVLPRWAALVPPGVFAASVLCFCFGLVLNIVPIVAFSFVLLFASIALFLVAPFVALLTSRHHVDDP